MQIKCDFYNYEYSNWHQYEIDMDLNVYPCCHYYTEFMKNRKLDDHINHIDNNLKRIDISIIAPNNVQTIVKDYSKETASQALNNI